MDIFKGDDGSLRELALFAGAGGGVLGGILHGCTTICAVERDAYAAQVLAQRQNDGLLPPFPIWSDVCSFDGKPWRGIANVVSGGFPCQDISTAGKGAGIKGKKSGMWGQMVRIIRDVRPLYAYMENSPALTYRGLGDVLGDLAAIGYDAEWMCLSADEFGAPHERDRIWILARDANGNSKSAGSVNDEASFMRGVCSRMSADTNGAQRKRGGVPVGTRQKHSDASSCSRWENKPPIHGVDDGVAHRVDRLKAIGNGQVPIVAATAFRILAERLNER